MKKLKVDAVTQAWERLEATLSRISEKTLATLSPPASEQDFQAAEVRLEYKLPPDVKAFFLRHNGEEPTEEAADGVVEFGYLLPLVGVEDSAVEESLRWDTMMKYPNTEPPKMRGRRITWEMTKYWLTIASDYGGNCLIVDCNPELGGKPGEVLLYDHEENEPLQLVAKDLSEFLDREREKLELGSRELTEWSPQDDEDNESDAEESRSATIRSVPEPAGRTLEDREWLEVVVRLPNILTREVGKPIQTDTMKEMDLALEFVSADEAFKLMQFRPSSEKPDAKYVAVTVYVASNPTKKFLSGYGGDGELTDVFFFDGEIWISAVGSGRFHAPLRGVYRMYPVFYWNLPENHTEQIGLQFTLRRRKPS